MTTASIVTPRGPRDSALCGSCVRRTPLRRRNDARGALDASSSWGAHGGTRPPSSSPCRCA